MKEQEYYIRKEEVAKRLGIKPRGVECLVTRGIIPCIKIKGPRGGGWDDPLPLASNRKGVGKIRLQP